MSRSRRVDEPIPISPSTDAMNRSADTIIDRSIGRSTDLGVK
jgi:hypothetical protein